MSSSKHTQRVILETAIYIAIISMIMAVFSFLYSQFSGAAQYEVVKSDLRNLKTSLEIYKYKTGRYPDNLKQLVNYFSENKNQGIIFTNKDKEGYPLDAFGNRYIYNKESFTVKAKKKTK